MDILDLDADQASKWRCQECNQSIRKLDIAKMQSIEGVETGYLENIEQIEMHLI